MRYILTALRLLAVIFFMTIIAKAFSEGLYVEMFMAIGIVAFGIWAIHKLTIYNPNNRKI